MNSVKKRRFDVQSITRFAPVIGLVLLVTFFAVMSKGKSISTPNLKILFNQVVLTALISIGGVFAFTAGAMDMSMSGSVCCVAVIAAIVGNATGSTFVMIATCVAAALLVGLIKAGLSIRMNVPPFMITIVLGMALSSLGNVLLGNQSNLSVSQLVPSGQLEKDFSWARSSQEYMRMYCDIYRPASKEELPYIEGFDLLKEAYEKLDAENRQNHSSSFTDRYHRILNLHCTGRMNGVVSVEFLRSQQGTFFDIQPNANEKADATVTADFDYFLGMAQGTVSFDKLFLGGQLTVEGNLAKGVQIRQLLTRPPRTE